MADWGKAVESFQRGSQWAQDFRSRRQLEQARDLALEGANYDMEARRATRKTTNPDAASVLGADYAATNEDWGGQLEDPFAFKLFDWFKQKLSKKGGKKRKALDLGGEGGFNTSNPVGTGEEEYAPTDAYAFTGEEEAPAEPYADGGTISQAMEDARGATQMFATQAGQAPVTTVQAGGSQPMPSVTGVIDTGRGYADGGSPSKEAEEWRRTRDERARVEREVVDRSARAPRSSPGASARRALDVADEKAGRFLGRAPADAGIARRAGAGLKRLGAAGALGATALEAFDTPTEQYRERFGLETDDPSFWGDVGVRALGAASDLGNVLTLGAAENLYRDKQRIAEEGASPEVVVPSQPQEQPQALPVATSATARAASSAPRRAAVPAAEPDIVDFGNIDIDPKEVPDMKMDDWKRYRAEMISAAQKSGNPAAVDQVNDMVTQMQMKGFLSYGQQGLALQQAGNVRGAMAAYRAAFQYFPNGNDVEFGTSVNKRTGRTQIVGFGLDEKTGKIAPGTELIMDPERVGVMLENFRNPQAFRMWTKDWRDFQQDTRKYEEVTKPLAQAQADAFANNSEAAILRAENAGLRAGGYKPSDMRGDATVFRNAPGISELMMTDPQQAQYLVAVMGQIKAANPQTPPDAIATAVMQSHTDGTLATRLERMGIQ